MSSSSLQERIGDAVCLHARLHGFDIVAEQREMVQGAIAVGDVVMKERFRAKPEFLEYRRTNFVIVLHDDGTLGEYMHLAPSGVRVTIGQRVDRGDELALSGNTGFSSTPHLHFQVMTAARDGISALSFPFQLSLSPKRAETPVQGRSYASWE